MIKPLDTTYFIVNTDNIVIWKLDASVLPHGLYKLTYTSSGTNRCKINNLKTRQSYYLSIKDIQKYIVKDPQVIETIKLLYEDKD